MNKIEKLTPQQQAQIIPHRDYWLNYILSCSNRTDKEQAKRGIDWLYSFCKMKPPIIIFVDSPLGCQFAANYLKSLFNNKSQVGAQVGAQVWDQVRAQVWAQVRDQVGAQKIEYFQTCSYGSVLDYGWVSWLDYFLKLDIVKSDKKEEFNLFKNLILSGVFDMIQLEGICIVSDMPTVIKRDAENRLHCIDDAAIFFKDGYGQYYVHGRNLPVDIFTSIKEGSLTAGSFFKIENEEVKSAAISMMQELYSEEYVFNFFREQLNEKDTYVDKKEEKYLNGTTGGINVGVYTLFAGIINDEQVAYVRCYCPSTDRMFFLGVDPSHTNSKDAIASLYRVPKKLRNNIKYIQRQGERFSTVFDDKGTEMIKGNKLSKEDFSDTTTITGSQYFSLIKYEY